MGDGSTSSEQDRATENHGIERWESHKTPPREGYIENWWCLEKRNSLVFNDVDFFGSTTNNGVALQSWIYGLKNNDIKLGRVGVRAVDLWLVGRRRTRWERSSTHEIICCKL